MSKNKLIIIFVLLLIVTSSVLFFIITPDENDNEIKIPSDSGEDITLENNYEALEVNNGVIDGEILVENHLNKIDELDSYNKVIDIDTDLTVQVEKNENIYVYEKDNTVDDLFMYYDLNKDKTFIREGSSITEVDYRTKNGTIDIKSYYNNSKLVSIINNVTIESINESDNNVNFRLESDDIRDLEESLDVHEIQRYNMNMVVSKEGVIEKIYIDYIYVTEDGVSGTDYIEYNINTSYSENVSDPHWMAAFD